jgi:hypothetical protein
MRQVLPFEMQWRSPTTWLVSYLAYSPTLNTEWYRPSKHRWASTELHSIKAQKIETTEPQIHKLCFCLRLGSDIASF